jgi:hypothetical protein
MGLLRYDAPLDVLLVTKGHPFERDAFHAVFDGFSDMAVTAVEQPAAETFFEPEAAARFDAIVCYDMPGIQFRPGEKPLFVDPPDPLVTGFRRLLDAGKGIVFLHHALAGWPSWDEYARILGGRFLYEPANLLGRECADSGYHHGVTHRITPVDATHPVTANIGDGFEITDEVYLGEVFEDDVVPLLRSDHEFKAENFYSASAALRGRMFSNEGWSHPPGSNLVAWARREGRSPLVYFASGDDPVAYENPGFRTVLGDAIRWVASADAHRWAKEKR